MDDELNSFQSCCVLQHIFYQRFETSANYEATTSFLIGGNSVQIENNQKILI